ncbi:serpin family protein [Phormidium sp. CLA17]|uniref:serpin family protein n=1 Tax=Leptolyngbya sp. Cla-17 TaxID=2803751 RepID=UPI001490C597|nr:serpin family protein [Leptolyngbya sp. Cla-17]MBM0743429.1 serpin family protein [Leptolyngbya sp. Cla-17]
MNQTIGVALMGSLLLVGLVSLVKVMPLHTAIALPLLPQTQSAQPKFRMVAQNTTVSPKLINANTRFGFKLFSAIAKQDDGKNVFISPSSVAIALAMAYNGANGETQQAMARAMELQGMSLQELNEANATLKTMLANPDPEIQLAIANSLWTRQGISFKSEFLQRNRQFYQAKVSELDFGNPRSVATINTWVSQNTRGKIDAIIDSIDSSDVMFLVNAIYFKGNWSRKFDPQNTALQPFYLPNKQTKQHPMMTQGGEYRYYETSQFQAVSLPYGTKRRMSLYVFLPQSSSSLANFQRNLTAENWEQWMTQFRQRQGSIQVPRFKLEYDVQLKSALSQLGMAEAFSSRANFSGLSQVPTKIDEVKHKTFVEVNETGTEAAAVTSIGIRTTSARPIEEPFRMRVDRPFFCAIRDDQTGTVLFMGTISNPKI